MSLWKHAQLRVFGDLAKGWHMWALVILHLGAESLLTKVGQAHSLPQVPFCCFTRMQGYIGMCIPRNTLSLVYLIVLI